MRTARSTHAMSGAAFTVFRALTRFGDLPLSAKALRVVCFPFFIVKAAVDAATAKPEEGAWRHVVHVCCAERKPCLGGCPRNV